MDLVKRNYFNEIVNLVMSIKMNHVKKVFHASVKELNEKYTYI